jgi:hypothetical protein
MRAYLEQWILHDGQLPEPAVGDTLRGIGLSMICTSAGPSSGVDSWQVAQAESPGGFTTVIEVDGEVVKRRNDPEAAIVRVGEDLLVVQGEWKDFGDAPYGEDPIDMRVVPVGLPEVGGRVSLVGTVGVMAEHEFEPGYGRYHIGTGMPDVRANWEVTAIHKERWESGKDRVVDVTPIEKIDAWADFDEPVIYALDLVSSSKPFVPPNRAARLLTPGRISLSHVRLRLHVWNHWFRRHWPWGRHFAG